MNPKLIIAILVIAAVPLGFFSLRTHQVTKADAQKVLKIIRGDKAKTQSYCDMTKLDEQIKQAKEKKDDKTVNELSQKLDLLEEKLGPEYVALMDGLEDIDPKSEVAKEIESVLDDLCDNLCVEGSSPPVKHMGVGGVIVLRARESRVQGEGRQGIDGRWTK